ncbi:MAG: glycosyltransferase [Flavobacteriales bacterium]|nr:glycosyltransferase [Flavobacteriales bacterium]
MNKKKKILVAPLNWGLGHATRCIPIIRQLELKGCEVIIGAEGNALQLLRHEFPQLSFIEFPGLKIKYPRNGALLLHFALRLPLLFRTVKKENQLIRKLVREHQIDGIISDNRYGVFHKEKPSVIITHQLFIESPIFKKTLQIIIQKMVLKFDECWVPDVKSDNNLSGELSHKRTVPSKIKYVGLLSRFLPSKKPLVLKRKLLVLLSGPEPQRTILEEKLKEQLLELHYSTLIVRGVVEKKQKRNQISKEVEVVNYLKSEQLRKEILESELVVCRSGYSSLMDLVTLAKKALLIPTPGQTEQEYLALSLGKKGMFAWVSQEELVLKEDVERAIQMDTVAFQLEETKQDFLEDFLQKC